MSPGESTKLAEWLQRIEQAHPAEIELGLERSAEVAARMGLAGRALPPAIVVAGTNGKGSCVAVMERLLLAQGHSTGAYTSPHLRRYNERVRLDGREVDDVRLCGAFAEVERARGTVPLTYFEFGTLAALALFRDARPAWLLLEVGLGGRLDAVNIVDGEVAVVTSIQLDHTDWLGPDRESIAREKAGIFRAGRPAVVAERDPPRSLRAAAAASGARWLGIGADFDAGAGENGGWSWRGRDRNGEILERGPFAAPALHGDNVAAALQALALVDALPDETVLARELPRIVVEGRCERRQYRGVECVLDVAHNPAGMALLAAQLAARPVRGRTRVVLGAMRDKELGPMLAALAPLAAAWVLAELGLPRAAPASQLAAALDAAAPGAAREYAASPAQALERAFAGLGEGDRVVICGSFHMVGPALDWFDARQAVPGEDA